MSGKGGVMDETKPLEPWQAVRYGDREATRAALAYYRERGWPVDDVVGTGTDSEIMVMAFIAGFEIARGER